MLAEYRQVFLEELEEQLHVIEEEILHLEQEKGSEQAIQSLFRAAHTLKGSSAAMGISEMQQLTHEMEHLLEKVRSKELAVNDVLVNLLFKSLDLLKLLKDEIMNEGSITVDISYVLVELRSFGTGLPQVLSLPSYKQQKPDLNLEIKLKLQESLDRGLRAYWIWVQISEDSFLKQARAIVIHNQIREYAEILFWAPDLELISEEMADSLSEVLFLVATEKTEEELQSLVATLVEVTEANIEQVDGNDRVVIDSGATGKKNEAARENNVSNLSAEKTKTQTVRVSVERLDHLMNLVGELVIDQTRIYQVKRQLSQRFASDDSVEELGHISDHLTRAIGELQESVMKARMLPIEQLFNRFPRLVRDLSMKLNKKVDLMLEGQETELDRTLIEDIADPLIHLIRNAIDHGIESPEQRTKAGKNPEGTLSIRAAHEDNQVVIYIEDDGAGIDPRKIRAAAVDKGIISLEEADALTDREAVQLIFRPGFSTAKEVSEVSGRGVGMDIVRSQIEKMNGIIDIETEVGKGTEYKIKLPLTLAIITGLLIRLSGQTFVIPMSSIAEIVRMKRTEIQSVRGESVIVLRNQIISVLRLHEHLHIPEAASVKQHLSLIIVGSAEKRVAIVVDELIGNQEVVLKSLGGYLGKVDFISGATILGDGSVALILEASSLVGKR